ncbi:MAG TPA: hypothetical protein VNI02_13815 [Blastocatellia bacterium]|jgi:RNA polymerase sigma factor (sigma-70 family)|nr:hypothetical protein [Blastocatellia bacterium]
MWLDSDRDRAGEKYERIRQKLIRIFTCRGCPDPEDLADETIIRVTRKVEDIADTYEGDPGLYFYGVANKVHLESVRPKREPLPMPPPDPPEQVEREYSCLERCMERLPAKSRELVLQYYQQDKRAKIDHRKELADRLGIALNALRIRAHRIRASLQECMIECLGDKM